LFLGWLDIFKNFKFFYKFLMFLNCFDILKKKNLKIKYFNIFLNKKYFKKYLLTQYLIPSKKIN